jgi:hypothetical protein
MEYVDLQDRLQTLDVGGSKVTFPSKAVWSSYRAMPAANSVTIDPHKMGYIPYAAGGISVRDKRILGLVSYSAAYVFDGKDIELNLASVILEGSKSGASAAGVWAAHRLLPQNISGYGQRSALLCSDTRNRPRIRSGWNDSGMPSPSGRTRFQHRLHGVQLQGQYKP